jgi:Ran GTPase-activating protein (RanGAP) involved in mRNA processing and transport
MSHRRITTQLMNGLAFGGPCAHKFKTLTLAFNEIGSEGLINTCTWFEKYSTTHMLRLDISFNNIEDGGAEALGKCDVLINNLEHLHLAGNSITGKGFGHIVEGFKRSPSLIGLDCSGNNGKFDGACHLARLLEAPGTRLASLRLGGNKIDVEGAKSLCAALTRNSSLTHLDISNNNIGDGAMLHLARALVKKRDLSSLVLCFNDISAVGMKALGVGLTDYHSLVTLALDNNKLADDGAFILAEALKCMSLKVLGLSFNKMETAGIDHIVRVSHQLQSLNVSGNKLGSDLVEPLHDLVMNSAVLEVLSLDHSAIGEPERLKIASGIASNSRSVLRTFDGFPLGPVMVQLGSPAELELLSNDKTLVYLSRLWETSRKKATSSAAAVAASTASPLGADADVDSPPIAGSVPSVISAGTSSSSSSSSSNSSDSSNFNYNRPASHGEGSDNDGSGSLTSGEGEEEKEDDSAWSSGNCDTGAGAGEAVAAFVADNNAGSLLDPSSQALLALASASASASASPNVFTFRGSGLDNSSVADWRECLPKSMLVPPTAHEQFKDVPGTIIKKCRDLAAVVFHPGEMWELNHYYHSSVSAKNNGELYDSSTGSSEDPESDTEGSTLGGCGRMTLSGQKSSRREETQFTRKRAKRTATRIERFPRIVGTLAAHKDKGDETKMLILLRQLRFLESKVDTELGPDVDIEALLLYVH